MNPAGLGPAAGRDGEQAGGRVSYRHWVAALFALAVLLTMLFLLARPAGG